MCVVSTVIDDWPQRNPWVVPSTPYPPDPNLEPYKVPFMQAVSREEFENLKKEVQALKKLIEAAKTYDEETGQKDCEKPELEEMVKNIAEHLGVDFTGVFDGKQD